MFDKEFFVNLYGKPALQFGVAVDDIIHEKYGEHDEFEHYDEILDQLSRIHTNNFIKKYPEQYDTYYCKKIITSTHITINYNYLIAPLIKIYCSDDGFTINDVALIIQKQYRKIYINHKKSLLNNKISRYLPIDKIYYESSFRFSIKISTNIPKIDVYYI